MFDDVTKPPLTVLKSLKARKGNNMFNLTVLSWLFPTEEGAKIPHSSVICFGDEISYCQSGMIRKKFSGKFAEDTITSLIEFDNVLGMDCRTVTGPSAKYDFKIGPNLIWIIFLTNAKSDSVQKIIVYSKIIVTISGIFSKITFKVRNPCFSLLSNLF